MCCCTTTQNPLHITTTVSITQIQTYNKIQIKTQNNKNTKTSIQFLNKSVDFLQKNCEPYIYIITTTTITLVPMIHHMK